MSGVTAPLTQTTLASLVSGTGRVTITRRMRLRSNSFCCAGVFEMYRMPDSRLSAPRRR